MAFLRRLAQFWEFRSEILTSYFEPNVPPVLHRPQKNALSPIFCTNLRLEAPLPEVYFSCTTFRRFATTSATLLIPKWTTRRWTLRWSNYSVAKRQQFSCALSTATSSLKFENVVPEGWIWFFPVLYLGHIVTAGRARTSTSCLLYTSDAADE